MWSQRPLTKLVLLDGLLRLHSADERKVTWLTDVAMTALAKDRNKISYMQEVIIRCG